MTVETNSARAKTASALSIFLLACLGVIMLRAAYPPQQLYRAASVANEVRSTEVLLSDATRQKQIPVRISYPDAPGTYPVIIFSHGAGHSHRDYSRLVLYWASHGYICIQPLHRDSLLLHPAADPAKAQAQLASDIRDPAVWVNRATDGKLVLTSLPLLAAAIPNTAVRMDTMRVGIAGHSLGAHTTAVLAGAKIALPGVSGPSSLAAGGISAALVISGHGRGELGLTDVSWNEISAPMMVITGSRDIGFFGRPPAWREEPYWFAPGGDKYLITFNNASHSAFTGMTSEDTRSKVLRLVRIGTDWDARAFTCTQAATLAFWDAYLKRNPAAQAWLESDAVMRTPCQASVHRK